MGDRAIEPKATRGMAWVWSNFKNRPLKWCILVQLSYYFAQSTGLSAD